MKKLITILLVASVFVLSGCTYLSYTGKDGRSISYLSTKEFKSLDVKVKKNEDGFVEAKLKAEGVTSNLVEQVGSGVVKGMSISSGAGIVEGIIKSRAGE